MLERVLTLPWVESLPSKLLDSLLQISLTEAAAAQVDTDGRAVKKQRTEPEADVKSICVSKFSVTYPVGAAAVAAEGGDIQTSLAQHFHLSVVDNQLRLQRRATKGKGVPEDPVYSLQLSPVAQVDLFAMVHTLQRTKSEQGQIGGIWAPVDVTIINDAAKPIVRFDFHIMWNETPNQLHDLRSPANRQVTQTIIDSLWPNPPPQNKASSPMDFYDAAYMPPKDDTSAAEIETPDLESTLFPYQKRTLKWMLEREGAQYSAAEATATPLDASERATLFDTFRTAKDFDGREFHISDVLHVVTRDKTPYIDTDKALTGGILAEEMGLGKTLEVLGLVTLNRLRNLAPFEERLLPNGLFRTGATLIVAPESLRVQWITEMQRHAPLLRVIHYSGCRKMLDEEAHEEELMRQLDTYDVIVTTYSVLSQEIHFATEAPSRSRRFERVYRRQNSPLVRMLWWRVCLDEAQMIESGVSQAAAVARLLPRIHAWGITGTPVKDDVNDLLGLLQFLRYQPFCNISATWNELMNRKDMFEALFRSLSLRHTKAMVRDEILLPPQKRYVITMPFSAVEEQHYQSLFKEMASECDVATDGSPLLDVWDPEEYETDMRNWLTRLRQCALHPEVGMHNRRALGYSKERPMRTVDEVLNAMLEQSETTIRGDERMLLASKLARGQLYENGPRVKDALQVWEEVRAETSKLVEESRVKLSAAIDEEKKALAERRGQNGSSPINVDSDDELDDMEANVRVIEVRRRLRGSLELHHKAVFFCASANFQIRDNAEMTEPESDEFKRLKKLEDDGYDAAKAIRREILQETFKKANGFMTKIKQTAASQTFTEIPELVVKSDRGIESAKVIDGLDMLYEELNEQANTLDEWREQVIQLLLKPLVDEEDDVEMTGEELVDSAKFQDDLLVYFQVLKSAIADRHDAISGQTNELVKHEAAYSLRLAKNEDGPSPKMMIELLEKRAQVKPKMSRTSMRGAIGEMRGLQLRLSRDLATSNRDIIENSIVSGLLKSTQTLLSQQIKVATALDGEVEEFKDAMNARLEYYRQLQIVSDAVIAYEGPKTEIVDQKMMKNETELKKKLASAEAKHRYLLNLKETGSKSSEPRMCVICQTSFSTGVLTVCGHQFCKECMMMWFKSHKNCPVCKKPLKAYNLHDITIKPQQLQVVSEANDQVKDDEHPDHDHKHHMHQSPGKTRGIYSTFNADKLAQIQNVELDGPSFTTKVDTLVRHLLWLRESDPGAKSIVFSQYRDFLHVLQNAFKRFRIGHASIDEPNGTSRFKDDPSVECFLLHARAHSSGLNLVNASHVFLCEPLLNTALELQAIARVDRIGQQHETTVWLYIVSGTVEESIYNLSVQRRLEHLGRNVNGKSRQATPELLDTNIEMANTLELERAALSKLMSKDRSAGEMVDKSDLWECLFGVTDAAPAADAGDARFQERAVMSYLAAEAADGRKDDNNKDEI